MNHPPENLPRTNRGTFAATGRSSLRNLTTDGTTRRSSSQAD